MDDQDIEITEPTPESQSLQEDNGNIPGNALTEYCDPNRCHDNDKEDNQADVLPKLHNTLFKPPNVDDAENRTVLATGMSSLYCDVSRLPPLPLPRLKIRRQESNVGTTVVIGLALFIVGMTHGVALTAVGGIPKGSTLWWTFLVMVYTETGIALLCLIGLWVADPGVVARSPETCFPIPIQCEPWIQAHVDGKPETVEPPTEQYIGSSNPSTPGDTYCVRCLVWRRFKHSTSYFHCMVCQRCVMHFDHHCSVFGRCIAGNLCHGNYKFFVMIIAMGSVGYLTCMISLLWSLSLRFKPQIVIPVVLACAWIITAIFMGRSCRGLCWSCQALALRMIECIRTLIRL